MLDRLHEAWTEQDRAHDQLQNIEWNFERVQADAEHYQHVEAILAPLREQMRTHRAAAQRAQQHATGCTAALTTHAEQIAVELRRAWDADLPAADHAAVTIHAGAGRLGVHRGRVRDAQQLLDTWTNKWQPVFDDSNAQAEHVRRRPAAYPSTTPYIGEHVAAYARTRAGQERPDLAERVDRAEQAKARDDAASHAYYDTLSRLNRQSGFSCEYDTGAAEQLPHLNDQLRQAHHRAAAADQQVAQLSTDPAITSGRSDPATTLETARTSWTRQRDQAARTAYAAHVNAALDEAMADRQRRHDYHTESYPASTSTAPVLASAGNSQRRPSPAAATHRNSSPIAVVFGQARCACTGLRGRRVRDAPDGEVQCWLRSQRSSRSADVRPAAQTEAKELAHDGTS